MRVYVKIWSLFLVASLLLTGIGLAINSAMHDEYDRRMMERFQSQVVMAADILQEQLRFIDNQLITLSVSGEANLFALYRTDKDRGLIYEKSNLLYQQLQMMRRGYAYIKSAFFQFPATDRQITDNTRYDRLDGDLYARLAAATDGAVLEGDRLWLLYMLSTNLVNRGGALVGVEISLGDLMNYCLAGIMGQTEVALTMGEPPFLADEAAQWTRAEGGWRMRFPVTLTTKGAEMLLSVFLRSDTLQSMGRAYTLWYAVLMLVMAVELLLFAYLLRRMVARPLGRLLDGFDQVARGNTAVRIHPMSKDEFADIYRHFNGSVERLDTLLVREYQAQMAAQRAEIKHLQAQIQPHFLYNAFYQMYRVCRMENCDAGAEFALMLSGYFEYITHASSKDGMVTLGEEIEHARKYINIQQFRFGDRLNACVDIPEELLSVRLPKLILQPVIENAVKYCIETDVGCALTIRVSASQREGRLLVTVEDSGGHMTDEMIDRQQALLDNASADKDDSGLANIHLRLRMSGEGGGIRLSRSDLGGLRVRMML